MRADSQTPDRLFARAEPLSLRSTYVGMWVLVAFILSFVVWAHWAELEEQIRTKGTIIVSSRSQVVQSVDGGVLSRLHVREGDTVVAGDLIAELNPVRFQASSDEIFAKVISLRATIQRLEAEVTGQPLRFSADVREAPEILATQTRLHERRLQLQREELESIAQSLSLAQQELEALERLAETGDAASSEVLRSRRQASELQGALTNRRNTFLQEAQAELTRSRGELDQAEQVLAQRREALDSTRLRAPMSGTVKNVRITTIGAVLRAGDELLQIVPSDEPMIIEAKVKPVDVAFVRLGLKANVKLDAYDASIYGSFPGEVIYISPDTLESQDVMRRDEEPAYRVHVRILEMSARQTEEIDVIPGMTSTVEIITGKRTVAQYLLKPLRRMSAEALVER